MLKFHHLALLGCLMGLGMTATAALPPGGRSLLGDEPNGAFALVGTKPRLGLMENLIGGAGNRNFTESLRLITLPLATDEKDVRAIAATTDDVKTGDVVLIHFWLRTTASTTGEGFTYVRFLGPPPDFATATGLRVHAGADLKEYSIGFQAARDYPAGTASVAFDVGFDPQTIEIGGISVVDYGQSIKLEDLHLTRLTYAGREPGAAWRTQALARIEKIRKGDLTIQVTDAAGSPVAGATIHAVLRRHSFGFGTCVVANLLVGTTPDALRYQQTVASLFNIATFENEMKWYSTWSGVPPSVDKAVDWLRAHDIAVRGHNMVWPSWRWSPRQLLAYQHNPAELGRLINKHITDMASHFAGKVIDWDVVNEPYSNHDYMDALGGPGVMIDWYKLANQTDPMARLFINDFDILSGGANNEHRDFYFNTIKFLKDGGAPLGGIGIQAHFQSEVPSPVQVMSVLDRFAQFGLPIESTEVSLNLDDEQLQADYLRDYTIAVFSHPAVEDIILWGFWAKRHWRPAGALYADDWSVRPIGQAWLDLMSRWKTDVTATADPQGTARVRGFYGVYDVTVSAGGKSKTVTVALSRGGAPVTVPLD
jgi:endo-1,4-beta-xylanase